MKTNTNNSIIINNTTNNETTNAMDILNTPSNAYEAITNIPASQLAKAIDWKRTGRIPGMGTYWLLSGMNTKILKSDGLVGVTNASLSLAPSTQSGHNVCPWSTPGCVGACVLWFAGRTVMQSVRDAMIRRTTLLYDNPDIFYALLHDDICRLKQRCVLENTTPYIRLNCASDLDWTSVANMHTDAQFYDYTKSTQRMMSTMLPNYRYTYSFNEKSDWRTVNAILRRGHNVAMVMSTLYNPAHDKYGTFPTTYRGVRVVSGDKHDIRHSDFDGFGSIVALGFKGGSKQRAKAIRSGFCVDVGSGWDNVLEQPSEPYHA